MNYSTNKVQVSYFVVRCHNQISLTTQIPDLTLTLGLFPDLSRIP